MIEETANYDSASYDSQRLSQDSPPRIGRLYSELFTTSTLLYNPTPSITDPLLFATSILLRGVDHLRFWSHGAWHFSRILTTVSNSVR